MGKHYEQSNHRSICGCARREKFKLPQEFCESCGNCTKDNWCVFFNRHIIKDYNRCFYHTTYKPVAVAFRCPDNLEEIMEKEEQKIA